MPSPVSIHAVAHILEHAPEHWTSGLRITAIAIADRVNADEEAWPTLHDIARRTGLSPRQVRRNLRQLEEERIIRHVGQRFDHLGMPRANVWKWLWICGQPAREGGHP